MARPLPQKVQTAAILQIASGLLNIFFMAGMSYFFLALGAGMVTAVLTCGLLPFGVLCGFLGFLLIPVGIVELITGILLLVDNEAGPRLQRVTSIVQKVAVLFGGLGSIVFSFVVDGLLRDPEAQAFLEGPRS